MNFQKMVIVYYTLWLTVLEILEFQADGFLIF